MELKLLPIDAETGDIIDFCPSMLKKLNNSDLTSFLAAVKVADKMKKEAENEIKKRLDEGQVFTRLSYSDPQFTRTIVAPPEVKAALIKKYGYDSVEPLTIAKLEKKYGEEVYQDLEPYIVLKPKKPAIKWDE